MNMANIYFTPADAAKELHRRREMAHLNERVIEYLKGDIPGPFKDAGETIAVLFRNIFTPDYELGIFLKHTKSIGARPVLAEYTQDRFVAKNEDKYALGKLYFYLNTDAHGHVNMHGLKIIDYNNAEGMNLCDMRTLWGELFVGFHHRIMRKWHSECSKYIVVPR